MRSPRILIVDDEPNIRLMLRTALTSEGYQVAEAPDGRAALCAIDAGGIDLVLLDLSMPVMDGMSVLEALRDRSEDKRPRVVVLTAYGSVSAAVKAVRLGASDFLEKPVTPADLRLSIAAVLEEPRVLSHGEPDLSYSELLQAVRHDLFEGDLSHAGAMLMRAADLAGTDPAYFNLLGVLHEAEGRKALAKKFYGKAVRADGKYEPARQNVRRLYELEAFGRSREDVALGDEAALLRGMDGTLSIAQVERLRKILAERHHNARH